ncbi:AEC family transporter [Lutispora thermophila]|uniref:Uncharacterized protein n=1 Tax=Lutispora thermophila DSM 19022 TaxID=1122184 RepID=A0A1M6DB44_9FIRM|nr:AEC family transporter [Lutispora thermophila]SHI70443.1 hypothetical protein SAMN02745176_01103 [Lutispora thermophila DSM 19022]
MSFQVAVNQILILFTIMIIGFICKKTKLIDENTEKSLSSVMLNITLPSLMLSTINVSYDPDTLPNMLQIFCITIVFYIIIILFANGTARLFRFKSPLADTYINLITFANVGFMGFPIVNAMLGQIGVLYATIVNLIFNLLLWTYGILIINKEGSIDLKKLFNIGTISSSLTIILFTLKIRMPAVLLTALDMIGDMTTPISMILIGSYIADIDSVKSFFDWRIGVISFFRLLLIPTVLAFVLSWLGINNTVISLCTILAAAPSGTTNAIFAKQFNAEPTFTSVAVFVTTLLFLVTLPCIIFILNNYILI